MILGGDQRTVELMGHAHRRLEVGDVFAGWRVGVQQLQAEFFAREPRIIALIDEALVALHGESITGREAAAIQARGEQDIDGGERDQVEGAQVHGGLRHLGVITAQARCAHEQARNGLGLGLVRIVQ